MIRKIPTDSVLVLFQCETDDCPDKEVPVDVSISELLQVGTPICVCCEEEMEPLGTGPLRPTSTRRRRRRCRQ